MTEREKYRELLKKYAEETALSTACRECETRYRELNSLRQVKPPILVFEIPWGEIDAPGLRPETETFRDKEINLRRAMYQWKHFQGDHAFPPYSNSGLRIHSTGIGLYEQNAETIKASTGSGTVSHTYIDQLRDEGDLEKLVIPEITFDKEGSDRDYEAECELCDGILPVRRSGVVVYFNSWDVIPRLHGVENVMYDLYDRPDFMHAVIEKFTRIHEHEYAEFERLGILENQPYYTHCTPALTYDLPDNEPGTGAPTLRKDTWCRAMAQIFGSVSPEMTEEFDFVYTKRLFEKCGHGYYGCCEPLDRKIDLLRKLPNLRRISITPWADVNNAAEKIGKDYVLSYKANPAYVAEKTFDPEPVKKELSEVFSACIRNNTPCEVILKDISTVSNNPTNLELWYKTAAAVRDSFFA